MATENTGILTDAGQKLIDRVNNSQTKITYTKVVFSSDDNSKLNDDQVRALTAIKSQDVVTNSPSVLFDDNTGATIVRTLDDNTKLTSGLYIRTYGLFAKDDSGNEILYAVTVTSNPDYLPSYDGMSAQEIAYSFQSVIKNTANVNFTDVKDVYLMKSDMGDYAEKGDLDKYETKTDMSNYQKLLSYTPADDLKVVHTTGDETIDGQKKFKTDPTDSAGNAYAKTVDVNQQLDKKVNVADMRKPASDVVGLEDVSTSVYKWDLPKNTDLNTLTQEGIYSFGTSLVNFIDSDNHWGTIQIINKSNVVVQCAICTTINIGVQIFFRSKSGSPAEWGIWTMVPELSMDNHLTLPNGERLKPADDSKVLHSTLTQLNSTDMDTVLTAGFYSLNSGTNGMPNADAWTIYQVIPLSDANGVQLAYETNNIILGMRSWNYGSGKASFSNWVQFADDSKVAHLSGTNNFDTVPTVKNNPLLLASSLPSDLARTGSDQEFTGKNTFDIAPIDKTTGNPYITKDGVPSLPPDIARTGQANTYTAAQTFSIAPTITDASRDKGDNQAATMADLKSVEDSAWIQLNATNGANEIALCRVDGNKLWVVWGFEKLGDGNNKDYSIGKVPQSIQGKNFSRFNSILAGTFSDVQSTHGDISVSSNSIRAKYDGYRNIAGWIMCGYFTFN